MSPEDYEQLVSNLVSEFSKNDEGVGEKEVRGGRTNKIKGKSGFHHQIDVSLKTAQYLILIECKFWNQRVGAKPVLVMASRFDDVRRANDKLDVKASIISTKEATKGARLLARYFDVQLDVVSSEKEYILRIHDRVFLRSPDSLPLGIQERAEVINRDIA